MDKIFISYKRQDKDIVFPIVEEIKQKTGLDCWIDLKKQTFPEKEVMYALNEGTCFVYNH